MSTARQRPTTVPAPKPPDDAQAWYAPRVRSQTEIHPGVVVTVRETDQAFDYTVRDDDHRAVAREVESAVDARCKRVINTWSPCVDWGLLARGGLEGLVAYRPDVYEQYAGALLAEESGVIGRAFDIGAGGGDLREAADPRATGVDGLYVAAPDRETCDRLVEAATEAL